MNSNEQSEVVSSAIDFLEWICHTLDLAQESSKPHKIDPEYIQFKIRRSLDLIWYDHENNKWTYSTPTFEQAALIVQVYSDENQK